MRLVAFGKIPTRLQSKMNSGISVPAADIRVSSKDFVRKSFVFCEYFFLLTCFNIVSKIDSRPHRTIDCHCAHKQSNINSKIAGTPSLSGALCTSCNEYPVLFCRGNLLWTFELDFSLSFVFDTKDFAFWANWSPYVNLNFFRKLLINGENSSKYASFFP